MENKSWLSKITPNQLLFIGMMVVIALIIFYSFTGAQLDANYERDLQEFRLKKDEHLKYDESSPLDAALREKFTALAYYPFTPAYRITADLVLVKEQEVLTLSTSQAGQQQYTRWAKAKFKLDGLQHEVSILKSLDGKEDKRYLFFRDVTSGKETYGGGRYVEIEAKKSLTCVIDFNMAYNPYCAYNKYFVCPIPPPENTLSIPIYAGERNFPLSQAH